MRPLPGRLEEGLAEPGEGIPGDLANLSSVQPRVRISEVVAGA